MTAYDDNPRVIGDYVTITADDTTDRHSRASQINGARRRYESEHDVTLKLVSTSYSETHGFLARSAFRYRITREPAHFGHAGSAGGSAGLRMHHDTATQFAGSLWACAYVTGI